MQLISKVLVFICILSLHPLLNAQAVPDPIDVVELDWNLSVENTEVKPDDAIDYSVTVSNLSTSVVATNVILQLTYLPDSQISLPPLPASVCEDDTKVITCIISELLPQESIEITVSARAETDWHRILLGGGVIGLDQTLSTNNGTLTSREFIAVAQPQALVVEEIAELPGTVDLGIEATSSSPTESGIEYNMRIFNQHKQNVATSPEVNIQLLEQEVFVSVDSCTVNDQVLQCDLPEIGPDGDYTFVITVNAINEITRLFADVNSQQPDRDLDNNTLTSTTVHSSSPGIQAGATLVYIDEFGNIAHEQPEPVQTEFSSETVVVDTVEVENTSQEELPPVQTDFSSEPAVVDTADIENSSQQQLLPVQTDFSSEPVVVDTVDEENTSQEQQASVQTGISTGPVVVDTANVESLSQQQQAPVQTDISSGPDVVDTADVENLSQQQQAPVQTGISSGPVVVDTADVENTRQEQEAPLQIDTSTEAQNPSASEPLFATGSGALNNQLVLFLILLIVISKHPVSVMRNYKSRF